MEYVFSVEILSFAVKGDFCYYCPFCNARLRNGTYYLYCTKADHSFNIYSNKEAINYIYFYLVKHGISYYGTIYLHYRKINIYAHNSNKEKLFNVDMQDFVPESIHSLVEIMDTYALFS